MRTFTVAQLKEAGEMQAGYCVACGEMRDGCEPDACEYECEACGQNQVYGAEEIMLMGLIKE